jgi:hypothetical protein
VLIFVKRLLVAVLTESGFVTGAKFFWKQKKKSRVILGQPGFPVFKRQLALPVAYETWERGAKRSPPFSPSIKSATRRMMGILSKRKSRLSALLPEPK